LSVKNDFSQSIESKLTFIMVVFSCTIRAREDNFSFLS